MVNVVPARPREEIITELCGLAGVAVVSGPEVDAVRTAWLDPLAIVEVESLEQAAAIVAWAGETGTAVVPWGAGTKRRRGDVRPTQAVVVSSRRLNRVIEVEEANLTAEVEAGVPLAGFQDDLAARGLRLPLDPSDLELATLGGTIATNSSGPLRFMYRTGRDMILGVKAVMPSGEQVAWGGKAIKNVAGYDVRKLLVGSWGTLGFIGSVTVRVFPVPDKQGVLVASFESAGAAGNAVSRVLGSVYSPSALELLAGKAADASGLGAGFLVLIGLEGAEEALERQAREIGSICREAGASPVDLLSGSDAAGAWSARRKVDRDLKQPAGAICCRVGVQIEAIPVICGQALEVCRVRELAVGVLAHAGTGVATVTIEATGSEGRALEAVAEIRRAARGRGGYLVVEQAPPSIMAGAGASPERNDYDLMGRIRKTLDPKGIFSPGRPLVW